MRMLMNNLDPDVAERPEDLVVYGGTGRAARSWEAFDAIVRTLETLRDDETLLVQSGKPVGVFRTHAMAPRVLISNSMLVPKWADWDTFRELEAAGLTMYGQMTAGSWIYIGTQGILQGTYETLAECAHAAVRRNAAGHGHADRRPRRHGRRAAARGDDERRRARSCVDVDPARIERRVKTRYLDRETDDLDTALGWVAEATVGGEAVSIGAAGQLRRGGARAPAARVAARHRHRSDERARSARRLRARRAHVGGRGRVARRRPRRLSASRATRRWPSTSPRWWGSWTRARSCSTTATTCARARSSAACRTIARTRTRGSCRRSSGRSSARARVRSAGRRCRATPRTSSRPTEPCPSCSRTTSDCSGGSGWPRSGWRSRDCPARICWLGYGERATARARASTRWSRRASCRAPIVIGRDHLDSGSVASPYRETEDMRDGSDAIADWPILNALVNTAAGAHWVSVHHGGGVGIGYSIHAGMVVVADGTENARERLERVLTSDPGTGRDASRRRRLRARARGGRRARRADPHARTVSRSAHRRHGRRPGCREIRRSVSWPAWWIDRGRRSVCCPPPRARCRSRSCGSSRSSRPTASS